MVIDHPWEEKFITVYFFAASHVILRTMKAIPEYGKRKGKHSTEGGDGEKVKLSSQSTSDENENKVLTIIFGIRERKQLIKEVFS